MPVTAIDPHSEWRVMTEPTNESASDADRGALMLRCPTCGTRFGVSLEGRGPENAHVACTACGHLLTTDEMLQAMTESLNDLLELARTRLSGGQS
jgi:predicted Zn finger-like uncharacterized protein